jgi:alpha-2-macroglobulin
VRAFWNQLKKTLSAAVRWSVGNVQWQAPPWAQALGSAVVRGRDQLRLGIQRNPRRTAGLGLAIVGGILAAALGWRWYQGQPKPLEVVFTVVAPAVTCYGCEPPGKPNPLLVNFEQSVAPVEHSGHELDSKTSGLSLDPAMAGTWRWVDDKTLSFLPAADWPAGQQYEVNIAHNVVAPQIRLAEYDFEFTSAAFAANISTTEFYQDPVVAADKKVVVSLNFTHPVNPEIFEKSVKLKMFTRETDAIETAVDAPIFHIVYDKLKLNAFIHTDRLAVPPKEGRLHISIDKGLQAAQGGNRTDAELASDVTVPGLNSLKVSDISLAVARDERNEPQQVLMVNASFSVQESEMPTRVKAWLLPVKNPDAKIQAEFERHNRGRPYPWSDSNTTPDIIAAATVLELTHQSGELDHYEAHGFRYKADPGRFIHVKVSQGLRSFGGYMLGDTVERILTVPEFPSELQLLHQGSLLALSGDKRVTYFSRNVAAIKVDIGRLLPRQLQYLITQTNGSFSQPAFDNWSFKDTDITERFSKTLTVPVSAPGDAHYEALDLAEYLDDSGDRRGVFLLRAQAWDVQHNRSITGGVPDWNDAGSDSLSDTRVIVVTDLGLLAKKGNDGSQDIFVQSIKTGEPVAGVTVDVLGRNGLPVLSEVTDSDGHVHFGDFKGLQNERQPVVYVARLSGDLSFLPVDERDRALDMSRFDVGGVEASTDRNALTAYLFSDRGLYRPGEKIQLAAIIRSQSWSRSLQGVPLMLDVTDPRGTVIRHEAFTPGVAGFGDIALDTKPSSPTGTYTFAISTVRNGNNDNLIGNTTVQVRDFQPDRLRMNAHFSTEVIDGWVAPEDLSATVQLSNLFGTAAESRRVTSTLTLNPALPAFRNFADYQFYDPQLAKEGFSEELDETVTDAQGRASLKLNLTRFTRATYRAHVVAQGFEADGGRGVTAEATQLISNMPYLVGYKADGDLNYVSRNASRSVQFLAIDSKLQKIAVQNLKLQRLEQRYVSVLIKQGNGTYKYESRRKEIALDEKALNLVVAGNSLTLATDAPGTYVYVIRDATDQALARIQYQVTGDANVTRQLEKNAELELGLSKSDYLPGEELELSIRAPYAGAGLITIERERVFAWRWFKTSTTSSVQHITLPKDLEGNAYVSVSFVRDPGSEEIYTSPLSYGVRPFTIDTNARRHEIDVQTAGIIKPGQPMTLRYRTPTPTRIVLFAVDEGILQVARHPKPDPLAFFFQKRALQVTSTQILDLVLPAFRQLGLTAAPGGDAEGMIGRNLNPFRRKGEAPVAFWSGILNADNTTQEIKYIAPDYFNGNLKVFAVAVSDARIGVASRDVTVRGDFVLTPVAPTTVTPGDEFEVSVAVANNLTGSGANAKLRTALTTDAGLTLVGSASQDLTIGEGREGVARFRVKANTRLGASVLQFTASSGKSSVVRKTDLSIRPATPYRVSLKAGMVDGKSETVAIDRNMHGEFRKLKAGVSLLPLSLAHGMVSYLSNYPYQCTEQIVSQTMPALVLGSRPEFGYVKNENGADLANLISELRARQNDNGAYKLWPGGDSLDEFVSLYAQHFLLEARQRGRAVPADIVNAGNNYLRQLAVRDGNNLQDERNTAYAIYLLTRQGQRTTGEISAQRKRLDSRYAKEWPQDLAAAWLAASMSMMKQDAEALRMLRGIPFGVTRTEGIYEPYYDSATRDAMLLYVTARYFPAQLPQLPATVLSNLVGQINSGSYHTLSTGSYLLALDAYATATTTQTTQLGVSELLRDKSTRVISLPGGVMPSTNFTEQAASLRFSNASTLNAFYLVEQSGFDRTPPTEVIKQGLEIIREYTDAQGKVATQAQLGQELTVHVKFRNLDQRDYGGIALVDLLPGGFELVVPPPTIAETDEEPATAWRCQVCAPGTTASLAYADMREDRMVFYTQASRDIREVSYRIKATNVGSFVLPPAYGEAMYDRSVAARSVAGRISVVRAP